MRIVLTLLAMSASVLLAQTPSGTIQGTVTDDQNQGVPAAIVTIHRTFATNAKAAPYSRTMKTASDGSVVAAGLPPGYLRLLRAGRRRHLERVSRRNGLLPLCCGVRQLRRYHLLG